jgi:hypothetical protein
MPINLKNWLFGNSEDTILLFATDLILNRGDFLVVTANAALFNRQYPARNHVTMPPHWHTLNNYNDTLCLWDNARNRKEFVTYRSDWFTDWKYQSLERVSTALPGDARSSWTLAAMPTPGQPNGAISWRAAVQPSLAIGPSPFTPNGDGRDDLLAITIAVPAECTATISIYGFSGKKVREFSGPLDNKVYWDGKLDNGSPAPVGPFFVVLETKSSKGTSALRKKGVLWR